MVTPGVTAVLITYQRRKTVLENLGRLQDIGTPLDEIIVVDNGSTDGTAAELRIRFPKIKLIRLERNEGIAAYNRGFAEARGEYILILDDDSYPAADAVKKGYELLCRDEQAAALAFKIIDAETGARGPFWFLPEVEEPTAVLAFAGCGALVRREPLCRLGGYAPEFFLYENELDLGLRMRQAGLRISYRPELVAYHPVSGKRGTTNMIYYGTKNKLLILWNYFSAPTSRRLSLEFLLVNIYLTFKSGFSYYRWSAVAHALGEFAAYRKRFPATTLSLQAEEEYAPLLNELKLSTWRVRCK